MSNTPGAHDAHDTPADTSAGTLPRHVAIIMDGNRRWAKDKNLPTVAGHQQGVETLKAIVRHAGERGIEALSVYAFSTENWRRAQDEVGYLMALFARALIEEMGRLADNNVRLVFIGDLQGLSPDLQAIIHKAEQATANNTGLRFQVAVNYGSRQELVHAARDLAVAVQRGELAADCIDEAALEARLDTAGLPELDLLIRTGGESRISNFLLWQAAYAELIITPVMWPECTIEVFDKLLAEFAERQRRFGR